MADPVSSVAYAIEAALRALGGHLNLLLPTMGLVVGIIALVTLNYWAGSLVELASLLVPAAEAPPSI